MLPNPYVILGTACAWLLSLVAVGWLLYARGHDDMRNAYTEQQLTEANRNLDLAKISNNVAAQAGEDHDQKTQVVHDTTREIYHTVTVPAASNPYLPVWFVRLLDRTAGRTATADPYPGKSDGDPSDVTLSEAGRMLAGTDGWSDKYYACRQQVIDTATLKPILPPQTASEKPSLLERINPFSSN